MITPVILLGCNGQLCARTPLQYTRSPTIAAFTGTRIQLTIDSLDHNSISKINFMQIFSIVLPSLSLMTDSMKTDVHTNTEFGSLPIEIDRKKRTHTNTHTKQGKWSYSGFYGCYFETISFLVSFVTDNRNLCLPRYSCCESQSMVFGDLHFCNFF